MKGDDALMIAGIALLFVGIIGGGFEIQHFKFPPVGTAVRGTSFIAGLLMILLGIGIKVGPDEADPASQTDYEGASVAPSIVDDAAPPADPRNELIAAIRFADDVEIRALQSLDTTVLADAYTGEALRSRKEHVKSLAANNLFIYASLDGQDVNSVQLNGASAVVELTETWTNVFYDQKTGQCLYQYRNQAAPQTIWLHREPGGWMISNILHSLQTDTLGKEQPCDAS